MKLADLNTLYSELQMAMATDNEERIKELKAMIGLIQRDEELRVEMGLESNQGWV